MMKNESDLTIPDLPDEGEYPEEIIRNYELLECCSLNNDMQTLFAAERTTGQRYVIKCFFKESPLYDYTEPEVLRQLNASPMPGFIAEYRNEQMRCVVREYVPGETLAAMAVNRNFSEKEVLEIGIQLSDQLQVLHSCNPPVIHRDIKPQNVIIRPDGSAVLIDFGISRVFTENISDTIAFGTAGFAPPEQYGFSRTDARSDIYALGMLLHWLLYQDLNIPDSPGTPLEKVIKKCTEFDPKKRYAAISQVKKALQDAGSGKSSKRNGIVLGIALAAALAVFLFFILKTGEKTAVFTQSLVEQAARAFLQLDENTRITEAMLSDIKGLYVVADAVYPDLDSFYSAVNEWYAAGKSVRGNITSLEDLKQMPNLEQVCMVAQDLEDISALAGLSLLNRVEFKHNFITDISALAGMKRLTAAGFNDNPVQDISPLEKCPNLAFLDLCDVRNYDPSEIAQLGSFDFLDISNPTSSYLYLDGKSILDLRLAWTGLDDLSVLDHVTRLERLEIDHTAVSDLSHLSLHQGLKVLKLDGLPVTDLSVLAQLPLLEEVFISPDLEPAMKALGDVSFSITVE